MSMQMPPTRTLPHPRGEGGEGGYERPSVGTTGLPTVHRMKNLAQAVSLMCVCRRAVQSICP
jgi:hypothetical protein